MSLDCTKDETWNVVVGRFRDRLRIFYGLKALSEDNYCANHKVDLGPLSLRYESEHIDNNWIYMFFPDSNLIDYVFSFDSAFDSRFREIQFAVRYRDFYNRYRFRIENRVIHFDLVKNGTFINSMHMTPFEVELGRTYRFQIVVLGRKLSLSVDGKHQMTIKDSLGSFKRGGVALILWDDEGRPIRGCFGNLSVHRVFPSVTTESPLPSLVA